MASLIVFSTGSFFGSYSLGAAVNVIGRAPSAPVRLDHPSVLPEHATVTLAGGRYVIATASPAPMLVVNGQRLARCALNHGDVLQVGELTLYFVDEGLAIQTAHERERVQTAHRKLESLFMLSSSFASLVSVDELMERMIDCLLDVFGADRGFVLLGDARSGKLRTAISRRMDTAATSAVSQTVARQVAQSAQPLLVTDVEDHGQLKEAPSIQGSEVRSIVCAPISRVDRVLGVIYLDSPLKARVFASPDLELLKAFGTHAAHLIASATDKDKLSREVVTLKALQKSTQEDSGDFAAIVGASARIRDVLQQAHAVARRDVTTLIFGESGTGKELLARAIHTASTRRDRAFVAVNCMALAPDIIESELFGHEKGAFTGAMERRIGRLELADGGTLFLDEIGELKPDVQVKLLRVLEERQIERVGSTRPIEIDVRLLTATNADLEKAIREGRFREDLYYRINVLSLKLPPLRERREDIAPLVAHFVAQLNRRMGRSIQGVSPDALLALSGYDWPGNIRELRNVLERAFVLSEEDLIGVSSLPADLLTRTGNVRSREGNGSSGPEYPVALVEARDAFERDHILRALRRNRGNVSNAAAELRVPRKSFYRRMEALGIVPGQVPRTRAPDGD